MYRTPHSSTPFSTMAAAAKANASTTNLSRRRTATVWRSAEKLSSVPGRPGSGGRRRKTTPRAAATPATPSHVQRQEWWAPMRVPVRAAPPAAPRLKRAWKRTRRPGVEPSAAVASTLRPTSTSPAARTVITTAAANGTRPGTSASAVTAAAQAMNEAPRTRERPWRSVRVPPTALLTAAPASAAESSSPKPPVPRRSARCTSAADTAHEPQKAPNRAKPTERAPSPPRPRAAGPGGLLVTGEGSRATPLGPGLRSGSSRSRTCGRSDRRRPPARRGGRSPRSGPRRRPRSGPPSWLWSAGGR